MIIFVRFTSIAIFRQMQSLLQCIVSKGAFPLPNKEKDKLADSKVGRGELHGPPYPT
jgi:hypothetical protein